MGGFDLEIEAVSGAGLIVQRDGITADLKALHLSAFDAKHP